MPERSPWTCGRCGQLNGGAYVACGRCGELRDRREGDRVDIRTAARNLATACQQSAVPNPTPEMVQRFDDAVEAVWVALGEEPHV